MNLFLRPSAFFRCSEDYLRCFPSGQIVRYHRAMKRQRKTVPASSKRPDTSGLRRLATWKLEDAKARLSEVVRLAGTKGPQLVTIRGKDAAVILSPVEFERLRSTEKRQPLVDFLQELRLSDIPLVRESDTGRDIDL